MKNLENLEKFELAKPSIIFGGTNGNTIHTDEAVMTREGMFEYKDKRGG